MGTAVVSGSNSAPVFQAGEHVFYFMALFIQGFVIGYGNPSVFLSWDAGGNSSLPQGGPEPVGIVSPVGQ